MVKTAQKVYIDSVRLGFAGKLGGGKGSPPQLRRGGRDVNRNVAKPPYLERTGWCWSMNKKMVEQHHYYGFALSRSRFAPVCAD